jgi:aminoglycoside phosphotransferase (APT) family kinase protein
LNESFERHLAEVLRERLDDCAALVSCERLSGGANQETYRLVVRGAAGQRKLALRRAAGGSGDALSELNVGLATEARLLELARAAGVPAPAVHYVLSPDDGLGDGFVMAWLEGETLGHRIVRAPELAAVRPALARQCGEILARIHAIDIEASALANTLPTLTPREEVEQTWSRYRALDCAQPMIDYTARWLLDHLPDSPPVTLVHNDFRNGNLMIDTSGVVGVLDWEIAHLGDPVRDLGWLCTHSWRFGCDELPVGGFGHIDDLLAGYAAGGGREVAAEHLRFWQVFGSFWWAVGCLYMADQYRRGPDRSVERPAIGRRSSECQADCVNMLIPGPVALVEATQESDPDLPRRDELLDSVAAFLREDAAAATQGRTRFFTRVAANSLAIVKRDLAFGPAHRHAEHSRLMALLDSTDSLDALRWRLTSGLRDGSIALDQQGLTDHLRASVINQLTIDQPGYPALAAATSGD